MGFVKNEPRPNESRHSVSSYRALFGFGGISLHLWFFILLPFTWERVQQETFFVVHQTTIVSLMAGFLFLHAALCTAFLPFLLVSRYLLKINRHRIAHGLYLFPGLIYFSLIIAKWITNAEYLVLVATIFYALFLFFATKDFGFYQTYKSDVLPIGLAVSVLTVGVLANTRLPLYQWKSETMVSSTSEQNSSNLIWIVFDELGLNSLLQSDGSINSDAYPGFSELAQSSTWYSNTVTAHTWTVRSVPAIFTGTDTSTPTNMPPPWLEQIEGTSLITGYSDMGLPMCSAEFCVSSTQLNATDFGTYIRDISIVIGHKFLPGVLATHLPPLGTSWARFGIRTNRSNTAEWWTNDLKERATSQQPFVSLTHSLLTHHPWIRDDDGEAFISPQINYSSTNFIPATCDDSIEFTRFMCTNEIMALNKRLYGMNARSADVVIQNVLRLLRESGAFDNTMIIVTADHGFAISTGKDGRRIAPSDPHWQDLVKVPLFVKFPHQTSSSVVSETKRTTQILASVLNELHLDTPTGIDPGLQHTFSDFRVDDNPQNVDFDAVAPWHSDGGGLADAENKDFPFAIGPLSPVIGRDISSIQGKVVELNDARVIYDNYRAEPSQIDQQYRMLIGGEFSYQPCSNGNLALVQDRLIVGTAHSFPSFSKSGMFKFWGVAQSSRQLKQPTVYCVIP